MSTQIDICGGKGFKDRYHLRLEERSGWPPPAAECTASSSPHRLQPQAVPKLATQQRKDSGRPRASLQATVLSKIHQKSQQKQSATLNFVQT